MKNANIRLLISFFSVLSIITLFNGIIVYWIPIIIPFGSFTAVRLVFLAFIKKYYWLLLLSLSICVLLFLTTISIYRRHILLPILSFLYLIYDFIILLSLLIDGLGDGYWRMYIIQTALTAIIIILLCVYFSNFLRKEKT